MWGFQWQMFEPGFLKFPKKKILKNGNLILEIY